LHACECVCVSHHRKINQNPHLSSPSHPLVDTPIQTLVVEIREREKKGVRERDGRGYGGIMTRSCQINSKMFDMSKQLIHSFSFFGRSIFIVSFHNLNILINHRDTRKSSHGLACIFKDNTIFLDFKYVCKNKWRKQEKENCFANLKEREDSQWCYLPKLIWLPGAWRRSCVEELSSLDEARSCECFSLFPGNGARK
jgi:hypothetical protein